ncbi:MAG: MFS transporter [Conexivisphaerales archaeon]
MQSLDELPLTRAHIKIMVVTGLGFFTDAYDLFIIGVANSIIAQLWKLSIAEQSILVSTAFISSVIGAVVLGKLSDLLGRRRFYGIELILMIAGALLSALSPNLSLLIIARFILGFGIGGDYSSSPTIMGEFANRKDRGKLIGMVFTMQAAGLIAGPLIALPVLQHLSADTAWRLLLGIGAVPAAIVFYSRRRLGETPRYLAEVANKPVKLPDELKNAVIEINEAEMRTQPMYRRIFSDPEMRNRLLLSSLAWFLLDFAFYGITLAISQVLVDIYGSLTTVQKMSLSAEVFALFALPGYLLSTFTVDRLGRKPIQLLGFAAMAFFYLLLGLLMGTIHSSFLLLLLGLAYFFTQFGPNSTTFVYPLELFPTNLRATGQGVAAASGKLGAFAGAFTVPLIFDYYGFFWVSVIASVLLVLGFLITLPLPETKAISLTWQKPLKEPAQVE